MKAIILARVSTEEQKEAGNSLPAQTARLQKYCNDKKLDIFKNISFDESAWKTKREEFKKIIEILRNSKEVMALCCDKIDRLIRNFTRDLATLEELRREGKIELHFPSDNIVLHKNSPASDLFRFHIGVGLSSYYSNTISDNVKRAYEQKIRNGEWIGKAPLGYKNITKADETKDIVFDDERAHLIRQIFEFYSTGNYSMKTLANIMNKKGLRGNVTGKPISGSQVELTLKNPFYYGMMRVKGQLYPHKYEPLISIHLFNKIKEVIAGYNRANFKRTNLPYVFRGLIKCPNCGCLITPELKVKASGLKYVYYHCTNYHGNCDNVRWIREEDLVEQLEPALKSLKLDARTQKKLIEKLRGIHDRDARDCGKEIFSIQQRIELIERRQKTMYEDKLDGKIASDTFEKLNNEYETERQDLASKLEGHSRKDEDFQITLDKILFLATNAYDIFKSSEPHEKTQFLIFLVQNSFLEGKNLLYKMKNPFQGVVQYHSHPEWLRGWDSNPRPRD